MSLWTPPPAFALSESNLTTVTTTTTGTLATAGAQHVKGAYVQLIASTAFDAYWVEVFACNSFVAATNTQMLLDIAIGAAAAETVIIPDLLVGHVGGSTSMSPKCYAFPLYIPAGSRVSARIQSFTASRTCGVTIKLYGGPRRPGDVWAGTRVTAYGITAASSKGVIVTPGVSGAEGAWTEIVAATTSDHHALVFGAQLSVQTVALAVSMLADVGIGAATEVQIASNFHLASDASERLMGPVPPTPIWVPVPNGTRLVARAMQHTTGAENINAALYGVT